jgi:hypothetical protein
LQLTLIICKVMLQSLICGFTFRGNTCHYDAFVRLYYWCRRIHVIHLFQALITRSNNQSHRYEVPFVPQQIYTIKSLPSYCIDHYNIRDFLIFGMSTYPSQNNVLMFTPQMQSARFKDWTLCLCKLGMVIMYIHIGG